MHILIVAGGLLVRGDGGASPGEDECCDEIEASH